MLDQATYEQVRAEALKLMLEGVKRQRRDMHWQSLAIIGLLAITLLANIATLVLQLAR